ncbi:MAG TPA: hypothetical protein VLM40_22275, partial [Gemmata sp.]|nr:hypothetical protein [Gemmata sp.]
ADRGAGIFMYYLFDEVNLAAPWANDHNPTDQEFEDALTNTRDTTAARSSQVSNLASDFLHVLFIDAWASASGAESNDHEGSAKSRGTIFTTSTTADRYSVNDPLHPWITSAAIQAEAFMCVLAHELTHLLIRPAVAPVYGNVEGVWAGEHLLGAANSADLMYEPANSDNRQLATVKFTVTTQQELMLKTAEGLV